ncbi:MAG: L,D-transpeptidase family protein [Micropepsaceae bacterium]
MRISRRHLLGMAGAFTMARASNARAAPDILVSKSGLVRIGRRTFRCALGRGGVRIDKHEGDGATPVGRWPLRQLFYRADRLAKPSTLLSARSLTQQDGWCDAPADPHYNTNVVLPYGASAEQLWRNDHVYDLIVVVGYNDAPVVPGRGSAIFLHIARENYPPTAGCVAFARNDLLTILKMISLESRLVVQSS